MCIVLNKKEGASCITTHLPFLLCAVLVFYFLKSSFRLTVLLLISGCAQKPMNVM